MYHVYIKPFLDLTASIVVLFVSSPAWILTSILIKLDSKGPVLFVQERTGLHGKNFKMYKFRTMACNNDVRDMNIHNQITKVGKVARALSLDEIPQFINVIKGDMSLIGPRPWIPEYYKHMTTKQRKRVNVRPGITGLAQAKGRNNLTITDKIHFDLAYVDRQSFILDTKIFVMTIIEALKRTGIEMEKIAIHHEINTLKENKARVRKETPAYIKGQLSLKNGAVFYSERPAKAKKKAAK